MHVFNNYGGIMKVGDKLICHNECVINKAITTIGRTYIITKVDKNIYGDVLVFYILNDNGDKWGFTVDKYKKWFITLSDFRKQKLEKLGCTSLIITEE